MWLLSFASCWLLEQGGRDLGTGQPSQPGGWAGLEGWCDTEGYIHFLSFETSSSFLSNILRTLWLEPVAPLSAGDRAAVSGCASLLLTPCCHPAAHCKKPFFHRIQKGA